MCPTDTPLGADNECLHKRHLRPSIAAHKDKRKHVYMFNEEAIPVGFAEEN